MKKHLKYAKIQDTESLVYIDESMVNYMTMGEYIKYLRNGGNKYDKKWTQEELGQLLNPPINRAAINKWESGQVENIKRSYIEQMSKLFGVKPCELMCFNQEQIISEEVKVIEQVQKIFGKESVKMLELFTKLNELGKEKALESLDDLSNLPKYTEEKGEDQRLLNA